MVQPGSVENRPGNLVLQKLPADEFARLEGHLQPFVAKQGDPLHRFVEPLNSVYFLTSGVASLMIGSGDGDCLELSIVGVESTVGERAIFAHDLRTIESSMLTDGTGFKVTPEIFRQEFNQFGVFHDLVLNNLEARIIETSQTALCNQTHHLEKRLLRWLLTVADRAMTETLKIKHEHIATRLNVTRPSVTVAATNLRKKGLIDYQRGEVTIIDRHDCEKAACECYKIIEHARSVYFNLERVNK